MSSEATKFHSSESSPKTTRRKITLSQACGFVGVGEETLLRFMESGYFPGSSKESGIEVSDLESVFGVRIPQQFVRSAPYTASTTEEDSSIKSTTASTLEASTELNPRDTELETDTANDTPTVDQPDLDHVTQAANSHEIDSHEPAFSSVPRRNLIEMYERLVGQLESELKSVRSERDWLKTRIERYEEKTSRDQLLMLAETQTIRNLINSRETRSPMRSALEWLGLLPPPADSSSPKKSQ